MLFKVGDLVIIDQQNNLNLSEWDPLFGKIIERVGFRKYRILLAYYDNIKSDIMNTENTIILDAKYITKIRHTNIIIRYPVSHPIINPKDISAMRNIIENHSNNLPSKKEDIDRLKIIINKVESFKAIFEREDNIDYGDEDQCDE